MVFVWRTREDGRTHEIVASETGDAYVTTYIHKVHPNGAVSGFALITVCGHSFLREKRRRAIEKGVPVDPVLSPMGAAWHFDKIPLADMKLRMSRPFMSPLECLAMLKDEA